MIACNVYVIKNNQQINEKRSQRDANTALAVVRFGHRPPDRPTDRCKHANTQTGPIKYTAPLSLARSVKITIARSNLNINVSTTMVYAALNINLQMWTLSRQCWTGVSHQQLSDHHFPLQCWLTIHKVSS